MTQSNEDLGYFQIQCQVLTLTLALEERQYLRYPPGTIVDGVNVGGQFATDKKSGSALEKKPEKAELGSFMASGLRSLRESLAQDKTLESRVTKVTTEISKDIVAQYDIDQSPFKLLGTSFAEKVESAALAYQAIERQIIDKVPGDKRELLGNLIKVSIPLAVAVSLTVGAEVAIGLLLGQTVGEMLIGSSIALGIPVVVNKVLDVAKIDNPIIRGMLLLAAGVATGGVISKVAKRITSIKNIPKAIEQITKIGGQFIEKATENPGIMDKIGDVRKLVMVLEKDKIDPREVLGALQREIAQDKRMKRAATASHSFSERLKEYVELSTKSDKNKAIEIAWKKGVIDAELKYGEHIDKVHSIGLAQVFNESKKTKKIYRDFLSAVKEGKTNQTTTSIVDKEFVDEYGEAFKQGERFVLEGSHKYRGSEFDIMTRLREVKEATTEASGLANVNLGNIFVGHLEGTTEDAARGFARTIRVKYDNVVTETIHYLQAGFMGDSRTLAFHEAGHFTEDAKDLVKTSVNYIASRKTKGTPNLIDGREVVNTDFMTSYTAKTYGKLGKETATEVVSVGMENLSSVYSLHSIVQKDIDHLRYTLFALDK